MDKSAQLLGAGFKMTVALRVVAMIAVIAMTRADFPIYEKAHFEEVYDKIMGKSPVPAKIINGNNTYRMLRNLKQRKEAVVFHADSFPPRGSKDPRCKCLLGIELTDDKQAFCGMFSLTLSRDQIGKVVTKTAEAPKNLRETFSNGTPRGNNGAQAKNSAFSFFGRRDPEPFSIFDGVDVFQQTLSQNLGTVARNLREIAEEQSRALQANERVRLPEKDLEPLELLALARRIRDQDKKEVFEEQKATRKTSTRESIMHLHFIFGSELEGENLSLSVPIYQHSSTRHYGNVRPASQKAWAKRAKVGIVYPDETKTISNNWRGVREEDIPLKLNIKWLNDLLIHGIFRNKIGDVLDMDLPIRKSYFTRPLIVKEEIFTEWMKTIDKFTA